MEVEVDVDVDVVWVLMTRTQRWREWELEVRKLGAHARRVPARATTVKLVFPVLGTNWKTGMSMELLMEPLSGAREMQTTAKKAYSYR